MHWNDDCDVGWLLGCLLVWADNYVNKTIRRVLVDRGLTVRVRRDCCRSRGVGEELGGVPDEGGPSAR